MSDENDQSFVTSWKPSQATEALEAAGKKQLQVTYTAGKKQMRITYAVLGAAALARAGLPKYLGGSTRALGAA